MAVPTQAYPPWLSLESVTVTQDGATVLQTSVVDLPQTYYGPSIPLDSDWVFGGSTFPASIATSFASASSTSTVSTSVAPSTSVVETSSQNPTTVSVSLSTSSTAPLSSSSSSPSAPTPSGSPSPLSSKSTSGVSAGTRLAAILSTILGTLLLAVLLLVLCRIRRRARRGLLNGGGISWNPVNLAPANQRAEAAAEEDEEASFLTREQNMQERIEGPVSLPAWPRPPPERPAPTPTAPAADSRSKKSARTKSDSSTLDSEAKRDDIAQFSASSSAADVGSLFFNPGRGSGERSDKRRSDEAASEKPAPGSLSHSTLPPGAAPPNAPAPSPSPSGPIVTPTALYFNNALSRFALEVDREYDNDLQRLNALRALENVDDDAAGSLLPPPRLDPDRARASRFSPSGSRGSMSYPDSPPSETDERATLLTARFVGTSPVSHARPLAQERNLEGWVTPPNEDDGENSPASVSPGGWSVSMGGLAGFAKGLGRLSWFRRMDAEGGPSGARYSGQSRSRNSKSSGVVGIARPSSTMRPRSGLSRPPFGSRPQSGVSFRSIDAELGLRPPGVRVSATGTGSGSGSGKSGATVYHSASSRPRTPIFSSGDEHVFHEGELASSEPMVITLPPDLDLGEGGSTVRSVDVLDIPIPERTLPFSPPVLPETSSRDTRNETVSSKGTSSGVAFPPGLVSVSKWDRISHSGSSNREARDALEDEPPKAGGEWSSLRSKASTTNVKEEGDNAEQRTGDPVTRRSTGEQPVQVVVGESAASETASIGTGRQPSDQSTPAIPTSRPTTGRGGISLTPRVSMYASSRSDGASHSGDGSYSSQFSRAASHSQGLSQPSSHDSEEGHPPPLPRDVGFNRASLSAFGGDQRLQALPQIPPLRPVSDMQLTLGQTTEDQETEGSDTSRPGTGTSKPISDQTQIGAFTPGTGSTGQTTVPSTHTTDSIGKR